MADSISEQFAQLSADLQNIQNSTLNVSDAVKQMNDILYKGAAAVQNDIKNNKEYLRLRNQVTKASEDYRKVIDDVTKATEKQTKSSTKAKNALKEFGGAFKTVQVGALGVVGALGGVSMSLKDSVSNARGYGMEMFHLSRNLQMLGRSMDGFNQTMSFVTKRTTLSRMEFAKLNNEIIKNFKGVPPTTQKIAEMAAVFNDKLGPGLANAQKGFSLLTAFQDKFPPMARTFENLTKLSEEFGKTGEKSVERRMKGEAALLAMAGAQQGMGSGELQAIFQITEATTEQQKRQQRLTEAKQKMAQATENLTIIMGEKLAPVVISMTENISKTIEKFQEFFANVGIGIGGLTIFAGSLKTILKVNQGVRDGLSLSQEALQGMGKSAIKASGALSKMGSRLKMVGKAAGIAGIAITALQALFSAGKTFKKARAAGNDWGTSAMVATAKAISKVGPTVLGAAIGSVFPGVGTLIGGAIGAGVSIAFGGVMDDQIDKAFGLQEDVKKKAAEDGSVLAMKETNQELSKEKTERLNIILALQENQRTQNALIEMYEKGRSLLNDQYNVMKNMGTLSFVNVLDLNKNLNAQLEQIEKAASAAEAALIGARGELGGLFSGQTLNVFQDMGIDLSNLENIDMNDIISGNASAAINQVFSLAQNRIQSEITNLQKELNSATGEKERINIESELNKRRTEAAVLERSKADAIEKQNTLLGSQAKRLEVIDKKINGQADAAQEINKVFSARLDMEAKLMSQAQFGFGASVKMMQKQVDMAYEQMEVEERRLQASKKQTSAEFKRIGISDKNLQISLEQAQSEKEIKDLLKAKFGEGARYQEVSNAIVPILGQQQKASKNIMEYQSKIYELTKDVREGYLDAIRQMSTGAGEFEKIIGKQDMGVSQLMKTVKAVTGEYKGNTMALGGYQSASNQTGKNSIMRYTLGGPVGSGGSNAMNQRLYGYEESAIEAQKRAMSRNAGSGVVAGERQNIREALRESADKTEGAVERGAEKGMQKGTENLAREVSKMVNPAFRRGGQGSFGNNERQDPSTVNAFAGAVARKNNMPGERLTPHVLPSSKSKNIRQGESLGEYNARTRADRTSTPLSQKTFLTGFNDEEMQDYYDFAVNKQTRGRADYDLEQLKRIARAKGGGNEQGMLAMEMQYYQDVAKKQLGRVDFTSGIRGMNDDGTMSKEAGEKAKKRNNYRISGYTDLVRNAKNPEAKKMLSQMLIEKMQSDLNSSGEKNKNIDNKKMLVSKMGINTDSIYTMADQGLLNIEQTRNLLQENIRATTSGMTPKQIAKYKGQMEESIGARGMGTDLVRDTLMEDFMRQNQNKGTALQLGSGLHSYMMDRGYKDIDAKVFYEYAKENRGEVGRNFGDFDFSAERRKRDSKAAQKAKSDAIAMKEETEKEQVRLREAKDKVAKVAVSEDGESFIDKEKRRLARQVVDATSVADLVGNVGENQNAKPKEEQVVLIQFTGDAEDLFRVVTQNQRQA